MSFETKLLCYLITGFFTISGGLIAAFDTFCKTEVGQAWSERVSRESFRLATIIAELKLGSTIPELRSSFLKIVGFGFLLSIGGGLLKFFPLFFIGSLMTSGFGIAWLSLEIIWRPISVIKFYSGMLILSVLALLIVFESALDKVPPPHAAAWLGIQSQSVQADVICTIIIFSLIFAGTVFFSLMMFAILGGTMVAGLIIVSKISAFLVARWTKNTAFYFTAAIIAVGAFITAIIPIVDLITQP